MGRRCCNGLASTTGISYEDRLAAVVGRLAEQLCDEPTRPQNVGADSAWPLAHCAVAGCTWSGESERDLCQHVCCAHSRGVPLCMSRLAPSPAVLHAAGALAELPVEVPMSFYDIYCEAVAEKERSGVPELGIARDQRTRGLLSAEFNDENIASLICHGIASSMFSMLRRL